MICGVFFATTSGLPQRHGKRHKLSCLRSSAGGTEYWLSLYSEGRSARSGRSVFTAVEGAEALGFHAEVERRFMGQPSSCERVKEARVDQSW